MKEIANKFLSTPVARFLPPLARIIRAYKEYDNADYWKGRASLGGQVAVLWQNESYNRLYREKQQVILRKYVEALTRSSRALDIGGGIGIVSEMIHQMNPDVTIDLVDFPEMIQAARERLAHKVAGYVSLIEGTADDYKADTAYDFVLSSGCYSAIRQQNKFWKAITNLERMVRKDGLVLMIDPFHKSKLLARARVSSREVIARMRSMGFDLIEKSGVLFWPYRLWLANSTLESETLKHHFEQGEALLAAMGRHFWADYKVLAFKKIR